MKHSYPIVLIVVMIGIHSLVFSQQKKPNGLSYLETEYATGIVLPGYSEFPDTKLQRTVFFTYGKTQTDTTVSWIPFYNFPQTAISAVYADYGNQEVFGQSYSILPQIVFNTSNRLYKTSHVKVGLGGSYFTKKYEWPDNSHNNAVGSHFMWTFLVAYYYNFKAADRVLLNVGGSYMHSLNSHVQLPNFGMNTVMLTISAQLYTAKSVALSDEAFVKPRASKHRSYYLSMYTGTGWHELGDAAWPKFTPKKQVISIGVYGSKVYNHSFRLKAGATYRFYQSYYDYIVENNTPPFAENPVSGASNIFISVGGELLMGHFGAELEMGLNHYKPFYSTFSDVFEKNVSGIGNALKAYIPMRIGLKAYAISNAKAPKNNVFLATHINANMGAADYMGVTFGYVRKLPF